MKEISTHGLILNVDPDVMDDYEILVLIKHLDRRELQYVPDAIEKLLGEKQTQMVVDAMKAQNEKGKCRITDMFEIVNDVISQLAAQDETAKK